VAGLIQWSNSFPEDATWEELIEIQLQFPEFSIDPLLFRSADSWVKNLFEEGVLLQFRMAE